MNTDHSNEESIFDRARQIGDPKARDAFVLRACGDDLLLRDRVSELLNLDQNESMFDRPPVGISVPDREHSAGLPGKAIGPYQIREQIGEGGMGVVYVAEQTEPVQRKVAIKVIKPGMDTKEVIARFQAERQALAFMEHPNIARVLDAGATENGRSYFVMELVRGIPITEYCDQVKATARQRLELFMTVCDAVQHAHQKGIIHRDIKPSNVLVTQMSAKPVAKVIDFGLAKATSGQKLTDKTLYTGFMRMMGTPAYMSPEQVGISGLDADTRSDVYSLGILLYELLTGTTPLDKTEVQQKSYEDLCKQIREIEAPKPSARISTLNDAARSTVAELRQIEPYRLRQLLAGDLDLIVLKAIDKDRERRYGSPQDLAADIQRFLDRKPILAVAPGTWYITRKLFHRNKTAISMVATILMFLIAATGFSTRQAYLLNEANSIAETQTIEARKLESAAVSARQREEILRHKAETLAEQQKQTAEDRRRELYATDMLLADNEWNRADGNARRIEELLASWIPVNDAQSDLREFSWRYQWSRLHDGAIKTVRHTKAANISPKGNLVIADALGIRKWDASSGFVGCCEGVVTSKDNRIVLSRCGRWAAEQVADFIQIIDIEAEEKLFRVSGNRAHFHAGGEYVAVWTVAETHSERNFELWNVREGKRKALPVEVLAYLEATPNAILGAIGKNGDTFSIAHEHELRAYIPERRDPALTSYQGYSTCTEISPDGTMMAHGQYFGGVSLRSLRHPQTPEGEWTLPYRGEGIFVLPFSPDSNLLAAGSHNGGIDIWDLSDAFNENGTRRDKPQLVVSLKAHQHKIASIVFSSDGKKIASRDTSGVAKLWDLVPKKQLEKVTKIAANSRNGETGVESKQGKHDFRVAHVNDPEPCDLTFINGGTALAIADREVGTVSMTTMGRVIQRYPIRGSSVVLSPDGKFLAMEDSRHLILWDLHNDERAARWKTRTSADQSADAKYGTLCFSPDGRYIAMGTGYRFDGYTNKLPFSNWETINRSELLVWDIANGKQVIGGPELKCQQVVSAVEFTPNGKWLLAAAHDGKLRVYDTSTWELNDVQLAMQRRGRAIISLAVSPDGKTIALSGNAGVVIFDFDSGKARKRHVLHNVSFLDQMFSHDGTLVGTALDHTVVLIDPVRGMKIATLSGHSATVRSATFSRDNCTLATIDSSGGLRIWRAPSLEQIDRGWLAIDALRERASNLNEEEKFKEAEGVLRRVLQMQQEATIPTSDSDLKRTHTELVRSLIGQGKYPIISQQPSTKHVALGDAVSLSVEVSNEDTQDFTYQWFLGGVPIEYATDTTYAISNVSSNQLGRYHVEIGFTEPGLASFSIKSNGVFLVGPSGIAKGGLRTDLFLNITDSNSLSLTSLTNSPRFPNDPDAVGSIGSFELPTNFDDDYGVRISGYLTPPKTGDYRFYLASDDSSELFLSTDDSPSNQRSIAVIPRSHRHRRGWQTLTAENVSVPILLQGGKRYWVEAHFREQGRQDHFAVTWQMPGEPPPKNGDPPINGTFLGHRLE